MRGLIQGNLYRITILDEQLIRLEYSENGVFEDRQTQTIINRNFPVVEYSIKENENEIIVETKELRLFYDKQKFWGGGLQIELIHSPTNYHSIWRYGEERLRDKNLKGTARTLDEANGAIELDDGLLSPDGFAVYDDSHSLVIDREDNVIKREEGIIDIYFFGYGRDYRKCLKAFHQLTGKTPLLPRYALGNWWSRYYAYTDTEYLQLFERFENEQIPFSVAVLDMDWHLVEIDDKYGTGWTGYSWDHELFPDYKKFLKQLRSKNLSITLNEHPAAGVNAHEFMYSEVAKAVGLAAGVAEEREEGIPFDVTSKEFMEAYFKYLHEPYEDAGVDFWWLDWQQGIYSKIKGLDPLWMLNHLHFKHSGKYGKRPMIFSRYAGVGSHRYPVGFSGDTYVTWESLKFQPYFTATASNIGFNWWSHDIGGHMYGIKDDELMVRWVQFGVFSPIMRLHSTNNFFNSKEPWRYSESVQPILRRYLQLRHQMIPYLYSINYQGHEEDNALVEPMYYDYPQEAEAYEYKNQYLFGRSMVVAPVLDKIDQTTYLAGTDVWLPEGGYMDFFTGIRYRGDRCIRMYRNLHELPVLVKEGSILPFDNREYTGNGALLPQVMTLKIYAGDSGEFVLYEDDGVSEKYKEGNYAKTKIIFNWKAKKILIEAVEGDKGILPIGRQYEIELYGVKKAVIVGIEQDSRSIQAERVSYTESKRMLKVMLPKLNYNKQVVITLDKNCSMAKNPVEDKLYELLCSAQIEYDLKSRIYQMMGKDGGSRGMIAELLTVCPYEELNKAFIEMITAY